MSTAFRLGLLTFSSARVKGTACLRTWSGASILGMNVRSSSVGSDSTAVIQAVHSFDVTVTCTNATSSDC